MILIQNYYEDHDSEPETETTHGTAKEIVRRFDYVHVKEIETCKVSKTKVELQAQDKGSEEGFYSFDISGTQAEVEEFLEAMYMEDDICWKAEFLFIPQKGVKCIRKRDQQLFFITQVQGQQVSLCSSEGEIISQMHISQVKEEFEKPL